MIKDFTWWSGLTAADAKAGLAMHGSRLENASVEGRSYWFAPPNTITPTLAPVAHLLPAYDEYTIAYKDHSPIFEPAYRDRIIAAIGIVIVIDGRIVGAWKRVLEKKRVVLTLALFKELSTAEQRAVAHAVQRYSSFLEEPIELRDAVI